MLTSTDPRDLKQEIEKIRDQVGLVQGSQGADEDRLDRIWDRLDRIVELLEREGG
jgi:hypothetical protein